MNCAIFGIFQPTASSPCMQATTHSIVLDIAWLGLRGAI
jgi:hypothetical protein